MGFAVSTIALPFWYQLATNSTATGGPYSWASGTVWDLALLSLKEPVPCKQCMLRPAQVLRGGWIDRMQLAGYPGTKMREVGVSNPFDADLQTGMARARLTGNAEQGVSGAPMWAFATAAELNLGTAGAPRGVTQYAWPAPGLVSAVIPSKSTEILQFTAAHIKWLFWAGARSATFLDCHGSGDSAACVRHRFASQ